MLSRKNIDYKVDFVMIWVDGNDTEWQKKRQNYLPNKNSDYRAERYRDMGLLRYWFRGIEKFAPWVNKIFFVTDAQKPEWLNCEAEGLELIKHNDYIPQKYLPTFSSHTIELNLHRITGLSNQFVYFNDDTFLIAPTEKKDFFEDNLPRQTVSFIPLYYDCSDKVFSEILRNNMEVIKRHFSIMELSKHFLKYVTLKNGGVRNSIRNIKYMIKGFPEISYSHLPIPLRKDTFESVWNAEMDLLDSTSSQKFRSSTDVNQYLLQYWQIMTGNFFPGTTKKMGEYFYLPTSFREAYSYVNEQKGKVICLNDGKFDSEYEYMYCCKLMKNALQSILPNKSKFEK